MRDCNHTKDRTVHFQTLPRFHITLTFFFLLFHNCTRPFLSDVQPLCCSRCLLFSCLVVASSLPSSPFFFLPPSLKFTPPLFLSPPDLWLGWKQSSETPSPSSSRHHALISPPTNFEHVYHMSPASAGLYLQKEASSQQSLPQLSSSSSSPSTSSLGRVGLATLLSLSPSDLTPPRTLLSYFSCSPHIIRTGLISCPYPCLLLCA